MPAICPFCTHENPSAAVVCGSCARDIAIPPSLVAERDDLLRKRDIVRRELSGIQAELERLKHRNRQRSV
jgi:hypothetical protein